MLLPFGSWQLMLSTAHCQLSKEDKVAVTIWKLATNVEYCTLSTLYDLWKVNSWNDCYRPLLCNRHSCPCKTGKGLSQISQREKLKEIVNEFTTCCGFHHKLHRHGSHGVILRPDGGASYYYKAITLQNIGDIRELCLYGHGHWVV